MVCSQYECLVNVFLGCDSLFEESYALVEEGHQRLVDYESGLVLGLYHCLSERLDENAGRSDGCLGRLSSFDELHQFHGRHWIEEVEAQDLVVSIRGLRAPGKAYRRGSRGEDRPLRRAFVDCREDHLFALR